MTNDTHAAHPDPGAHNDDNRLVPGQSVRMWFTLIFWSSAVCAWWTFAPRLLGVSLPFPLPTLGAAFLVPPLLLWAGFWVVDGLRSMIPRFAVPKLSSAVFAILLAGALLSPSLVISHVFGLDMLPVLTLLILSCLGTLLITVLVLALSLTFYSAPGPPIKQPE